MKEVSESSKRRKCEEGHSKAADNADKKSCTGNFHVDSESSKCASKAVITLSNSVNARKRKAGIGAQGAVFTSRQVPPTPQMMWVKSEQERIRIKDTRPVAFPVFEGCPDWAKPLMFAEYQVFSTQTCSPALILF
jgi:hypothetical protein